MVSAEHNASENRNQLNRKRIEVGELSMKNFRLIGFTLLSLSLLLLFALGCSRVTLPWSVAGQADQEKQIPTATLSAVLTLPTGLDTGTDQAESAAVLPAFQADGAALGDIPQYDLSIDIDFNHAKFTGESRVTYTNLEAEVLDSLFFRLYPNGGKSYGNGNLQVEDVEVNGEHVEINLSLDDTVLEVALSEPLDPGDTVQVDMNFSGSVPEDFDGQETPAGYGIYNLSADVLALSGWYPQLAVYDDEGWNLDSVSAIGDSVYSDTAFYSVDVSLDDGITLAATGVEVDRKAQNSQTVYQYISGPVRDFFMVMSPDFMAASKMVDGTMVNSYYLPGHEQAGEIGLQVAGDSLAVFNQRFGAYPYTELDLIEAPMRNALGVEYPGIMLAVTSLYDDPTQPSFSVTVAHEVAHQWWYSLVGNDVLDEPWLDEALATYSSGVYMQDVLGQPAYEGITAYWDDRYAAVVADNLDDLVTEDLKYFEGSPEQKPYSTIVYSKGALALKAIREEIGDKAFFEALQNYYQANKYLIAVSDDLLASFEKSAGSSLDRLYEQWLYTHQ